MTFVAIVAGVLAYPVIAGVAYRLMRGTVPPEPEWCGGRGINSFRSSCKGAPRQSFPHVTVQYPQLYCDACNEWVRWRVSIPVLPRTLAWLWPIAWVPAVFARLFNAGANVTVTPSLPLPESAGEGVAR